MSGEKKNIMTDSHLKILEAAYEKAAAEIKKKATKKAIEAFTAAKSALEAHRRAQAGALDPDSLPLANIPEALEYLQSEGWKIEKSKLYADAHMIKCEKDGSYSRSAVDKYAEATGLARLDGTDPALQSLSEQKLKKQVELLEIQRHNDALELEIKQKKWVKRSRVESLLAARASLLKNSLGPEFIHACAARIIEVVEGNPDRVPELVVYYLDATEDAFDRYAAPVEFAAPIPERDKDAHG